MSQPIAGLPVSSGIGSPVLNARPSRLLNRAIAPIRALALGVLVRARAVNPDRWFLLGMVILLLVFLVVLVVQPSSVGRGGR